MYDLLKSDELNLRLFYSRYRLVFISILANYVLTVIVIDKDNTKSKVRVYIDGWFDLIHAGHFNSFRQAKKLGDVLVLGINSDEEVEAVKGPTVFNWRERCTVAGACKWVDEIIPDTIYTPTVELIDELKWDFYTHGDDIALNSDGVDSAAPLKEVGRFKLFRRTRGVSTTDIAAKLMKINKDGLDTIHEDEEKECEDDKPKSNTFPKALGAFNANPNFFGSAKRIAHFANTREPLETEKIVYVDGWFDVCHPGHIEQLKKAKELGDFLIVGIHDDLTISQYVGKQFPLNALHERVLNILACKYVDDVIIGAPFKITERLLKDLNVSIVVKSLETMQGVVWSEALALNPYELPEKYELIREVNVECQMTMKDIAKRVIKNKEAMEKKILKYSARQDEFESKPSLVQEIS